MSDSSLRIAVLGLGNWGTALAHHLALKGYSVTGWSIDRSVVDSINSSHRNPAYLSDRKLSPNLKATTLLSETEDSDVIVVVLPSAAIYSVLDSYSPREGAILVSAVKGFDSNENITPLEVFGKCLPQKNRFCVLSGPSFAADIVAHKPAGIVVASVDSDVALRVAELFSSETLRVYTSDDPLGVELGGIVKNVIALAVGVCDGLELGDSARAGLVTRGLAEMMRFASALGAKSETLIGLSGLGDLVVTATSDRSRNRTVGLALGRGEKLQDILDGLGSVAEGVRTAPILLERGKALGVDMPITESVTRLLNEEFSPQDLARMLINRPIKSETA